MNVQQVEMSKIDRPSDPVRDSIDPDEIRQLAESIREIGLQEPIIVRPVNGRYEVVAGDRRYLAHKFLEAKEIFAIVKQMTDEECILVRATENDQRVNLKPLERAKVYQRLYRDLGMTMEQIAKKMGRSTRTVKVYLDLLEMPEKIQQAVNDKKIGIEHAVELGRIDDPQFQDYYFEAAVNNGVTLPVLREWVADYFKSKAAKFYENDAGIPVASLCNENNPIYVTCAGCGGPCEIHQARSFTFCPDCQRIIRER